MVIYTYFTFQTSNFCCVRVKHIFIYLMCTLCSLLRTPQDKYRKHMRVISHILRTIVVYCNMVKYECMCWVGLCDMFMRDGLRKCAINGTVCNSLRKVMTGKIM